MSQRKLFTCPDLLTAVGYAVLRSLTPAGLQKARRLGRSPTHRRPGREGRGVMLLYLAVEIESWRQASKTRDTEEWAFAYVNARTLGIGEVPAARLADEQTRRGEA